MFVVYQPPPTPPLLIGVATEEAASAAGELLLPPAMSVTDAATAPAPGDDGDGRNQLLLLGSVKLLEAGEGHGVGAAGAPCGFFVPYENAASVVYYGFS